MKQVNPRLTKFVLYMVTGCIDTRILSRVGRERRRGVVAHLGPLVNVASGGCREIDFKPISIDTAAQVLASRLCVYGGSDRQGFGGYPTHP
jgi:hypothetical protein